MRKVKVSIWGFGAMGSDIARTLLYKEGVEITGVCDSRADRIGKEMHELLGITPLQQAELVVQSDIDIAVPPKSCDVCVIATSSFIKDIYDKVISIVQKGINVITIAEEMSYPWAQQPELAKQMDAIAKHNGVSVLGTGINPGLVMDLLAICVSGCMTQVDSVQCNRINSLSPFGVTVMREQGIGLSLDAFEKGVKEGEIAGHIGFAESVYMISDALGLDVDTFSQQLQPIVTETDRHSACAVAKAGQVAGVRMVGQGMCNGKVVIDMRHPQQIEPEQAGVETGDFITLHGTPEVNLSIRPEISGGYGTVAMCVNCIPHVINARPGLRTMIDIPVPHAIMKDFREYIDLERKVVK